MAAIGGQAVKARRHRPDAPARGGAPQFGQGKIGAGIFGRGVLAVDRDMRDAQVVVAVGIAGIDRVEFCRGVVGRARTLVALVGLVWRRGRDDRDAALAERLSQRLERHLDIVRPFIRRAVAERRIVVADPLHIRDRHVVIDGKSEPLRRPGHLFRTLLRHVPHTYVRGLANQRNVHRDGDGPRRPHPERTAPCPAPSLLDDTSCAEEFGPRALDDN